MLPNQDVAQMGPTAAALIPSSGMQLEAECIRLLTLALSSCSGTLVLSKVPRKHAPSTQSTATGRKDTVEGMQ